MTVIAACLLCATLGASVVTASLFAALVLVCNQRNDLRAQLDQRENEADEQQAANNDLRGRLSRKPKPYRELERVGGRA